MKFCVIFLLASSIAYAQQTGGYLSAQDQKYFKNDSFDGNNQRERIDNNVKEINKLHGEVLALKAQIEIFKKELEDLKKAK